MITTSKHPVYLCILRK